LGESDVHFSVILYLRQALRYVFRHTPQTYVAANMFLYYEEGNPEARRAPDVFVVKGVPKHDRRVYKLWEEPAGPCLIFEITSRSTRLEDVGTKRGLYELLGVNEYFLFDPLAEYLSPPLQGFRLVAGYYQPLPLAAEGTLVSAELGVILKPEGTLLRIIDPATGQEIPTLDEAMEQTEIALEQAQQETERANLAETETARLQAEVEQLRRQLGQD
jgi:hypothetical protein